MTDRIKRPPLERGDPIRNWSTLLGGAGTGADGARLEDVITRSVDLGYRVIDAYVSQGQKAAQRLGGGTPDPVAVTGELQELSVRMAQYASELVGLWFQAMDSALRSGPRSAGFAAAAASPVNDPAPTPPAGEAVRVRVEVASLRPVEVGVDLRPIADPSSVVIHALRAVDPDTPPLNVSAVADADPSVLRLRVHVPDNHPAGVYSGLILDARSNLPLGALSLRVERA